VRPQSILISALALVFGGSAAVGVNTYVNRKNAAATVDTVPVVVAVLDIPRGSTITVDLVKVRDYPKDAAPEGAIARPADVIDRTVFIPLVKGDAVVESKLAPKGMGKGLASLVPSGMRAITIQTLNVATGVAGFVLPGNRVDVLLSVTDSGGGDTGGGSTTTLLQNVEILAVDQRMEAPADNKVDSKELRSVTLLVTPRQANLLDLGQNKGMLRLALRNLEDHQDARTVPVTLADLRFRREKPWDERAQGVLEALGKALAQRKPEPKVVEAPPPPKAPVKVFIRTIRGSSEGGVSIERPEVGPDGR
jgi:pilus assembly protein CpaB